MEKRVLPYKDEAAHHVHAGAEAAEEENLVGGDHPSALSLETCKVSKRYIVSVQLPGAVKLCREEMQPSDCPSYSFPIIPRSLPRT